MQKSIKPPISIEDCLQNLRDQIKPRVEKQMALRMRRKLAYLLNRLLRHGFPLKRALDATEAITGVRPSEELTAREAYEELVRHGVFDGKHFLADLRRVYRLAEEHTEYDGQAEFLINAEKEWAHADFGVRDPRAKITVLCTKNGPRYIIAPITSA